MEQLEAPIKESKIVAALRSHLLNTLQITPAGTYFGCMRKTETCNCKTFCELQQEDTQNAGK